MKLEFSQRIFEKYSNTTLHENPSSGSLVVPYRQTDGRRDMTKLIVAFWNFANKLHLQIRIKDILLRCLEFCR